MYIYFGCKVPPALFALWTLFYVYISGNVTKQTCIIDYERKTAFEEFHRQMGYIHFGKFLIFEI